MLRPRVAIADLRTVKPPSTQGSDLAHYRTPEHRAWREAVIARAGGRCELPGCGRADGRMYADHIRELKDGGAPLDLANGQCLCPSHHSLKSARARKARMR